MASEPPASSPEQGYSSESSGEPETPSHDTWLDDSWGQEQARDETDREASAPAGPRTERERERQRRGAPREPGPSLQERLSGLRTSRIAPVAVVAVLALIGFIIWIAVSGGSDNKSGTPSANAPVVLSSSGLQTIATTLHAPMFWAGTKPNSAYELTQTGDGKFIIRYVPNGTAAGAAGAYVTVGTYPLAGAFKVARAAASAPTAVRVSAPGNAIAFYGKTKPTSVYVTYPGLDNQIEVYAPSAVTARRIVSRGAIVPVPGSVAPPDVKLLTATGLRAYAAASQQPVFWIGPQRGVKYEVTRKGDGSTLVRYLPDNAQLGDPGLHLTVGSYPIANAYAVTVGAAKAPGAVRVKVPAPGVALYNDQRPSNIYVSRPSWNSQVELFDPDPVNARTLVSSDQVVQVK